MKMIGNILWFFLGGIFMGLSWWALGVLAYLTIVGIPWAKACFVIGQFSFFPFGKEAVARNELSHELDVGTGVWGLVGNVIWFLFGGFWLAVGHLSSALLCFISIIGIPFAFQHIKLAKIALAPIGKTIINKLN